MMLFKDLFVKKKHKKEVAVEGLSKQQAIDLINFVHDKYGSMATMAYGRKKAYIGTEAPAKDKELSLIHI